MQVPRAPARGPAAFNLKAFEGGGRRGLSLIFKFWPRRRVPAGARPRGPGGEAFNKWEKFVPNSTDTDWRAKSGSSRGAMTEGDRP